MTYKENKLDNYHYMLLTAFARNDTDMWTEFVMEFVDEIACSLPIVNSTIIRVVRAFLHEHFDKPYNDYPRIGQEQLERIGDIVNALLLKYRLNMARYYSRLDLRLQI